MPKYAELADLLKEELETKFQPGDKFYSQRELMKIYGLSFTTVDKALRLLAEQKLVVTQHGSGTYVAERRSYSQSIKFRNIIIFTDYPTQRVVWDSYMANLYNGIKSAIVDTNVSTAFASYQDMERIIDSNGYDGVILISPRKEVKDLLRLYEASSVHAVIIGPQWPDIRIPVVDTDIDKSIQMMVNYLAERGRKRLGFVTPVVESETDKLRRELFCEHSRKLGMEIREDWIFRTTYDTISRECVDHLKTVFTGEDHPEALMFSTLILVSDQVISELNALGLNVPSDVLIAGYDDPGLIGRNNPPVTIIRQQVYEIGRRAVEKLMRQMDGMSVDVKREMLNADLVEREFVVEVNA